MMEIFKEEIYLLSLIDLGIFQKNVDVHFYILELTKK